MKRTLFWISVVVAFIVLAAGVSSLRKRETFIPHFVSGAPAPMPQITRLEYEWSADVPFQNDQLWCWTISPTGPNTRKFHAYLYDLKNRRIQGELLDGSYAGVSNVDGSRILVRNTEIELSFQEQIYVMFAKMFGRKVTPSGNRLETYWVLDISRNAATKVGRFSQYQGSGSIWHSSPDFRRAYNMPSTTSGKSLYVCDLDNVWLAEFNVDGYPKGWWDDRHILLEKRSEQFELFDIQTRKTTTLFTQKEIRSFLARAGITGSADVSAEAHWNGTNFDFQLGLGYLMFRSNAPSFRIEIDRAGPSLRLASTNFLYRWGGSFNASGDLYLIQGENGAPGSGGDGSVIVRHLTNGTESIIVPPDNKGQYSIPRFYRNEVIYYRDRLLHRVALDGSNDSLLLTNEPAKKALP